MNDSEFIAQADHVLKRIELALDATEGDLDCSMPGAGILEVEFGDGGKIIINRHGVTQEIWVAARSGGFHFRWDGESWLDTRSGRELMAVLSELVSAQTGQIVTLR